MATDQYSSITDRLDYARSTIALPTVRFPPMSPMEERAQFAPRRPRWADVWPVLAFVLLTASLYIALHISRAGWGFAVVVLTFALWPARTDARPSKRMYCIRGPWGLIARLRGDAETDAWFDERH